MKNISQKCTALIEESQKFLPSYGEYNFTNHLPMSLLALDQIGGKEYLKPFYESYSKKLHAFDLEEQISVQQELSVGELLKAEKDYEYNYHFFLERIKEKSVDNVITDVLEEVTSGVGSGAFHCLIRLAYSIESGIVSEIASALAYFVSNFSELGSVNMSTSIDIDTAYKKAKTLKIEGLEMCKSISGRMRVISGNSKADFCKDIPQNLHIKDLANFVAKVYGESDDNFTCLHLVTSCHALRIISPYIKNIEALLGNYYVAVMYSIISVYPLLNSDLGLNDDSVYGLEELLDIAKRSPDDHTIKIAYTCSEEYKIYKNKSYINALEYRLKKEGLL